MAMIELKEGDVIVNSHELNELLAQQDEAVKTLHEQKVLINQSIKVVSEVEKIFPGLFSGKGFGLASFNPMDLINNPKISALGPDCERLKILIEQYKSRNPVII